MAVVVVGVLRALVRLLNSFEVFADWSLTMPVTGAYAYQPKGCRHDLAVS